MMPEIKKFTDLNIEKELCSCLQSADSKILETIYEISYFFLTDDECIFVYDLADGVIAKHIDCYLNQYWKEFWTFPDNYTFLFPFITKDLLKNGFIKYSAELSRRDHQHLYDYMFATQNSYDWSDSPYAE